MSSFKYYGPGPVPPLVNAKIPVFMTFAERVYWYAVWIEQNPYSHIHFHLGGNEKRGFMSERHLNL